MATTTLRAALAEVLPAADDTDNHNMSDVIGNKSDTSSGNSIIALLKLVESRLNNPSKVYPTLANGVAVASSAVAWTLGTNTEVVPVNTITTQFLIYLVKIEAASATDIFEVVLYSGAGAGTEIGRFRTNRNTDFPEAGDVVISTEIIAANSRISARIASKTAGAKTLTVSIHYVTL